MAVLTTRQRNHIQRAMTRIGLRPSAFWWSSDAHVDMTETESLHHGPSGKQMTFNFTNGQFWLSSWPPTTEDTILFQAMTWEAAVAACKRWLMLVRAEPIGLAVHVCLVVDAGIATAAATIDDVSRFTQSEIAALRTALADLEGYLQNIAGAHKERIARRLAYLAAAAELQNTRKVDWMNLFVAQVVALVLDGALPSEASRELMDRARSTFASVYRFGDHFDCKTAARCERTAEHGNAQWTIEKLAAKDGVRVRE